jgi:hypothetical protein
MIFLFGNPTRAEGKFFRVNSGSERERWEHRSVDSHNRRFTALRLSSGTLQNWRDSSDPNHRGTEKNRSMLRGQQGLRLELRLF